MENDMETVHIWGYKGCLSVVRHSAADLQDLLGQIQGRGLAQLMLGLGFGV